MLVNPKDWGTWRATVHGVTGVGHDLATKERERDTAHCTDIFFKWYEIKFAVAFWEDFLCLYFDKSKLKSFFLCRFVCLTKGTGKFIIFDYFFKNSIQRKPTELSIGLIPGIMGRNQSYIP